jgi:uncharacterized protein (DUF983 family)
VWAVKTPGTFQLSRALPYRMSCMSEDAIPYRPEFKAAIGRGLRLRCPRCGDGRLYKTFFRMNRECNVCGLGYYRESGYYVGAMMINYGITAALVLAVYLISRLMPEIWHASPELKIATWMCAAIIVSLLLVRTTRGLWLAFDYWVEPWMPLNRRPIKSRFPT